jgi:hypothetical protein
VAGDARAAECIATQVPLVKENGLELLDLAMGRIVRARFRKAACECIHQGVNRSVDARVTGEAHRKGREDVATLAARALDDDTENRDRAALMDACTPRARPWREPRHVTNNGVDIPIEVGQIGSYRTEPGGRLEPKSASTRRRW